RGRRVPRFGQREPGIEGELPRLAFEAVTHRPRLPAGGLHDEIEATTAAVGYLLAGGRRLHVLDVFGGELWHFRYPAVPLGNKNGRSRLFPSVMDSTPIMGKEQAKFGLLFRRP